ncbi:unnamed protein product [Effrenium voratum]|uniref:EH domain-containing protein n=1 Tax=Effrenium voratum TaxID=2562239 RepID=A0AA36JQ74_9DINO|nr:unnamed protein product [Effrenium voratum]
MDYGYPAPPPVPSGACSTQVLGAAPFSAEELQYYQQLHSHLGQGPVDGRAGANFLMQSGLPMPVLHDIWEIADSQSQGVLSQEQFYNALRLVAWAQAGREVGAELIGQAPPALPDFAALSPSSKTPSGNTSPRPKTPTPEPHPATPAALEPAFSFPEPEPFSSAADSFGAFPSASAPETAAFGEELTSAAEPFGFEAKSEGALGDAFGAWGESGAWQEPAAAWEAPGEDPFRTEQGERSPTERRHKSPDKTLRSTEKSPKSPKSVARDEEALSELSRRFEKVLAADREVSKLIREEMQGLEDELRSVQDSRLQLDRQNTQEAKEREQLSAESQRLELQLSEAKQRLLALRDDCRAMNLESLSMRRDRSHLAEEMAFLQRSLDTETRSLEGLAKMNQSILNFNGGMEANAELLARQRKELQLSKEQQQARQEERQNNELRNLLDRRRREQAAMLASHQDLQQKHQLVRAMQTDNVSALSAMTKSVPLDGHSWATSLLGSRT